MKDLTIGTDQHMTSLEIAELTGKQHKHVLRDIKELIEQGAVDGSKFGLISYMDSMNREKPMYSLDFNATMTLITGYDAVRRAAVIDRWTDLETGKAQPIFSIPSTLSEALRLAADQAETIEQQVKQIEEYRPKARFADAVSDSHTSILVGELAKLIKQNGVDMGANRLFTWMRENNFLIKRKGADWNMPTQYSMERGLFEIKERAIDNPDGSVRITKTPKVTGKGQVYFINKIAPVEQPATV